jgi:hypothetical protein
VSPRAEPGAGAGADTAPVGRTKRLAGLLARNWLFAVLFTAATAIRVVVMLAYRPVLPLPHDAAAYVERSVTNQVGDSFHPFLYPLILKPFIAIGHVGWVSVAQHAAVLGAALLLFLLLRRLDVHPVIGALSLVPVLFDGYQLNIEHHVLAEAFFEVFIVAGLVLLVWWQRPPIVAMAGAGVLLAASSLARFPGLAVIVAAVIYVIVRRLGWLRFGALIGSFVLTLGVYSVWFNSQSGRVGITNREGFFLYGRVVEFADCTEVPVAESLRVFCPPKGFQPDKKGLFTSGLPDEVRRDPANNDEAMSFAWKMIAAKPTAYLSAVLGDFLMYFRTDSPASREARTNPWVFKESLPRTSQEIAGVEVSYRIHRGLAGFVNDYQRFAWSYGPLLALLLVVGAAGAVAGWRTKAGRPVGPEALLFTLAGVGVLLFPTVFAVYHIRYVLPALPLAGPAGALGLTGLIRRFRPSEQAAPSA